MNYKDMFSKWGLSGIKLNLAFLEVEFTASADDQKAAWEMYVELITRIVTQELEMNIGDELTALESVYSLFSSTRAILKENGRQARSFSKIAIIVLNQIIRPFTAKWHREQLNGAFKNKEKCAEFREDLTCFQKEMRKYSAMLAEIAAVEDITDINNANQENMIQQPK